MGSANKEVEVAVTSNYLKSKMTVCSSLKVVKSEHLVRVGVMKIFVWSGHI